MSETPHEHLPPGDAVGALAAALEPGLAFPALPAYARRPPWYRRIWNTTIPLRSSRVGMVGFSVVAFWIVVAIFGHQFARYDPNTPVVFPVPAGKSLLDLGQNTFPSSVPYVKNGKQLQGVVKINSGPSSVAWLGTDDRGRDIYSRLVEGARPVMTIAPLSILLGAVIGILIGLAAGYYGRWIDETLMRLLDMIIAFPSILILLLILSSVGASKFTVIVAIAVGAIPGVARLARGMTLDIRTREYVAAARLRGESGFWIMVREIFPNASGPIIIDLTLRVGYAVFAIATLGFLGLGLPPPTPDWGTMVAQARIYVASDPTGAIFPALAISTLVVGLNLMADGIRQESARYR
jgi:peptide/nickel transport system permease protein